MANINYSCSLDNTCHEINTNDKLFAALAIVFAVVVTAVIVYGAANGIEVDPSVLM